MAARKIGATIALDGEAKFKSAVSNCNKSLKEMRSEMELVKEKTSGQANSLSTLKQKHDVLAKSLDKYKEKQTAVASGLEHAQSDYERVGKTLENYKTQLSEAQKKLDDMKASGTASQEEMDQQQAKVDELATTVANGEKAYEKAGNRVQDWQIKLNTAETEVVKANRALDENDQYMAEAEQSTDKCATSIDEFGKKTAQATTKIEEIGTTTSKMFNWSAVMDTLDRVSQGVAELESKAYDAAKELDEGYDTITAKTGATGEAMQKMAGIADNLYSSMSVSMDDVGAAVGEVNTRFGLQGDQLQDLSEQFLKYAELNGTDVSGSIDSVQKALSAFGLSAENASDLLDLLNKVGQDTGASVDTLTEGLVQNGTAFQEMGLSIEQSTVFMGQMEKSGANSETVMQGLRKALKNATSEGIPLDEALSNLQNTIKNGTSSVDGLTAAYDLFGKSGDQIYGAVQSGTLDFSNLAKSVAGYGDSVSRTFEETEDPWDKAQEAMHSLQIAGSDLTQDALGTLTPAIEKVADVSSDAVKTFDKMPTPIKAIIGVTGLAVTGAAKVTPVIASITRTYGVLKTMKETTAIATAAETAATTAQTTATEAATVAQTGLNIAMDANPVGLLALAIGGLVTGLTIYATATGSANDTTNDYTSSLDEAVAKSEESTAALKDAANDMNSSVAESFNTANQSISGAVASAQMAGTIIDDLDALNQKQNLTSDEQQQMARDVATLNTLYPEMGVAIDDTTGKLNMSTQAMSDFVEQAKQTAMVSAYQKAYEDIVNSSTDALEKQIQAQMDAKQVQQEASDTAENLGSIIEDANTKIARQTQLQDKLNSGQTLTNSELKEYNSLSEEVRDGQIKVNGKWEDATKLNQEYSDALRKSKKATDDYDDAAKTAKNSTDEMNNKLNLLSETAEANGVSMDSVTSSIQQTGEAAQETAETVTESAQYIVDATGEVKQVHVDTTGQVLDDNDELVASSAESVQLMTEDQANLQSEYVKTYNSNLQSIQGQIGMFDELTTKSDVSASTMLANMQGQADAYTQYTSNLQSLSNQLAGMNGSDIFLSRMADGSEKSIQEVQALVDGLANGSVTADQIMQTFGNLDSAQQNMATHLTNMQTTVDSSMNAIASDTQSGMSSANANAAQGSKNIQNTVSDTFKDTSNKAGNYGKETGTQYSSRLGQTYSSSRAAAQSVAKSALEGLNTSGGSTAGWSLGMDYYRGITSTRGSAGSAAQSIAAAAVANLNKHNEAYNWGADMGNQFARGLSATVGAVSNAANAVANAAAKKIHHSTPDEGPLKGDDKWGYEMAENFASGMLAGVPKIESAAYSMAKAAAFTAHGSIEQGGNSDSALLRKIASMLAAQKTITPEQIYEACKAGTADGASSSKTVLNGRQLNRALKGMGVAYQ